MRKLALLLFLMAALACRSSAQNPGDIVLSADFTFGPLPTTQGASCAPILSWDGVDNPYPFNPGDVCAFVATDIGIAIPWQLGFLNNGFLFPCNQMAWGDKTWTIGDGITLHDGDAYTQPASTTCPYFTDEYGGQLGDHVLAGFTIVANFTLKQGKRCVRGYHGTCFQYVPIYTPVLQGGKGTAIETQL